MENSVLPSLFFITVPQQFDLNGEVVVQLYKSQPWAFLWYQ